MIQLLSVPVEGTCSLLSNPIFLPKNTHMHISILSRGWFGAFKCMGGFCFFGPPWGPRALRNQEPAAGVLSHSSRSCAIAARIHMCVRLCGAEGWSRLFYGTARDSASLASRRARRGRGRAREVCVGVTVDAGDAGSEVARLARQAGGARLGVAVLRVLPVAPADAGRSRGHLPSAEQCAARSMSHQWQA